MNDRFYLFTDAGNWEGIQLEKYWLYGCFLWLLMNDESKKLKGTYFICG